MAIINNTQSLNAAQTLMASRQQIKALEEQEAARQVEFAESIFADAIRQPSRVLPLDFYWRQTGLLPMDVMRMVDNGLKATENPAYSTFYLTKIDVKRRYAEFSEDGQPTGNIVERTECVSALINLGAVTPDDDSKEVTMGRESLIETDPSLCTTGHCWYRKQNRPCPTKPSEKWKCNANYTIVKKLVDQILNQR